MPGLGRSPGEGKGYPGEFHGPYSPWDHTESNTTEQLSLFNYFHIHLHGLLSHISNRSDLLFLHNILGGLMHVRLRWGLGENKRNEKKERE